MGATVLIVDDHRDFRTVARRLLELDGYEIVGEAPDGRSGVQAARELRPQIVVLDVQLPDIDGFEVAAQIAQDEDPPTVVLTSTRERSDFGDQIDTSPVRGFVHKSELSGETLAALVA